MCALFGFTGETSGGLLTSGTSIGTVVGMAAARHKALKDVKENGVFDSQRLVFYASTETHGCVIRALQLLGLGSRALHSIPTDDNFSIRIPELMSAINDDRSKGLIPFCIVGNAGKYRQIYLSEIARYFYFTKVK